MLQTDTRTVYDADLNLFRDQVRKFYARALVPNLDRWEAVAPVNAISIVSIPPAHYYSLFA